MNGLNTQYAFIELVARVYRLHISQEIAHICERASPHKPKTQRKSFPLIPKTDIRKKKKY